MADKFVLTGELEVRLSNQVNTAVNDLKKKVSAVNAKIGIDRSSFDSDIKYLYKSFDVMAKSIAKKSLSVSLDRKEIDGDVKYIYGSYKLTKDSINKSKLNIRLEKTNVDDDINYLYKSYKTALNGISSKEIKIKLDRQQLDDDINYLYKSYKTANASLSKVNITINLNKQLVDNDIKYLLASFRMGIKALTNAVIPVKFTADISPDFQNFENALNNLSNKTIRIKIPTKDKTIAKFSVLANNIRDLASAIALVDVTKIDTVATKLSTISSALGSLASLSRRKYTFDFKIKNLQNLDAAVTKLNKITTAFNTATTSAANFQAVLAQIAATLAGLTTPNLNLQPPNPNGRNSIRATTDSIEELGKQTAITFKRFGAYTLATTGFYQLGFAIKNATQEFIEYDRELIKVKQVTGQSDAAIQELSDNVTKLATSYGVSSNSILNTSLVLAQAGFSTREVNQALEALTKTELAATFEDIGRTVEGVIAGMAQFKFETKDLEEVLSGINTVSAKFAVESEDIITATQKTGGAFAAAGGSYKELQALFTSVRATTRESADTIATGFRTIFTRLQRVRTQEFLRNFGIDLNYTAEEAKKFGKTAGEFVGPYEAVRRLNAALDGLGTADPRFAQITEELGGFRQINKTIPLIKEFEKSQQALNVIMKSNNSLTKDAETAQESFANQLTKVHEEFLAVIREFGQDKDIRDLAELFIDISKTLVDIIKYTKELIPLFAAIGGVTAIPTAASFLKGAGIIKRADGGFIPGNGTKDDQPALLMKGEYVLNKRAVRRVGVNTLDQINFSNRHGVAKFAKGGRVGGGIGSGAASVAIGASLIPIALPSVLGDFMELIGATNKEADSLKENFRELTGALTSGIAQFILLKTVIDNSKTTFSQLNKIINGRKMRQVLEQRDDAKKNRIQARGDLDASIQDMSYLKQRENRVRERRKRSVADYQFLKQRARKALAMGNTQSYIINRDRAIKERRNIQSYDNTLNINAQRQQQKQAEIQANRAQFDAFAKEENDANLKYGQLKNNRKRFAKIAKVSSAVGVAGSVAGQFISGLGDSEFERIKNKYNESGIVENTNYARNMSVGGEVLGGAVSSAGIGATVGMTLGPHGAVIGAAAGLIYGAATSYLESSKKFDGAVKRFEITRISDELSKVFKDIDSGKTNTGIASSKVIGSLTTLRRGLQSSDNPDVRKDILATLDQNSIEFDKFAKNTAKTSSSLADFNMKIDETTQGFLASVIGIPIEEFKKQIEEQIDSVKRANEFANASATAKDIYEEQIRSISNLNKAFNYAESKVLDFSNTFNGFLAGSGGSANFRSSFGGAKGLNSIPDVGTFSKEVKEFSGQFGEAGKLIGDEVISAAGALKQLPEILLKIRKVGAFGDASALSDFFSRQLEEAGIGTSIRRVIESRLPLVLGQDFKDSELFKKIDENLGEVMKNFVDGFDTLDQPLNDASQKTVEQLQKFASGVESIRSSLLSSIADLAKIEDYTGKLIQSRDSFKGRRPSFDGLLASDSRKTNTITGGLSVGNLALRNAASKRRVIDLDTQINSTKNADQLKQLTILRNNEVFQIEKTTMALKHLADNTSKLSILEQKLAQSQSDRLKNKDFATDYVFGDRGSQRRQSMILTSAQMLDSTGNINTIMESLKSEVLSLLKGFGDTLVPGTTRSGNDILNNVLKNAGVPSDIVDPNKQEQNIQALIEQEIKNSANAQKALNDILASDRLEFSKNITTQFDTFLVNLSKTLNQSKAEDINNQIQEQQKKLNQKLSDLEFLNKNGGSIGIENAESIKQTEKRLAELASEPDRINARIKDQDYMTSLSNRYRKQKESIAPWDQSIGFDKIENLFNELTDGLSDVSRNAILAGVQKSDLGANYQNKTVNFAKTYNAIVEQMSKQAFSMTEERNNLLNQKSRTLQNVGGGDMYNKILARATEIEQRAKNISSRDTQQLTREINALKLSIDALNKNRPPGFATGGIVPGSGNFDSVPARLTPGEGIITKSAMQKYGPGLLTSINKGSFPRNYASGGVVTGGINIDMSVINRFNTIIQNLATQVDRIQQAFSVIPRDITMTGRHTVEIIVNGAQVMTSLYPEIARLVEAGAKDQINKMLKSKFPNVGSYNA